MENYTYRYIKDNVWYKTLKKSPLTPPDYVFGIVCPLLYVTLLFSFIIFNLGIQNKFLMVVGTLFFLAQLYFNIVWPIVFFNNHEIKNSISCLIVILFFTSIYLLISYFYIPVVFYITLPYYLWNWFMFRLNLYILKHNRAN